MTESRRCNVTKRFGLVLRRLPHRHPSLSQPLTRATLIGEKVDGAWPLRS